MRANEIYEAKTTGSSSQDEEIKRLFDEYFELGVEGAGMFSMNPGRKHVFSIKNGLVNIKGSCFLKKQTSKLPIKFGIVTRNFLIGNNKLTSLEGSPRECGSFECNNNQLVSLAGGPEQTEYYHCERNKLTDLIGGPKIASFRMRCQNNPLTSLEGLPEESTYFFITY